MVLEPPLAYSIDYLITKSAADLLESVGKSATRDSTTTRAEPPATARLDEGHAVSLRDYPITASTRTHIPFDNSSSLSAP